MTIKKLIGSDPNQVPMNRDLGSMAYQDAANFLQVYKEANYSTYTANTNITPFSNLPNGHYLLCISGLGTYHYNGITAISTYDSADFGINNITAGNYQTTMTLTLGHSYNDHSITVSFNQSMGGTSFRLYKLMSF